MPGDSPYPVAELIRRCVLGDSIAWEEFIGLFHPLIARTVVRKAHQWGVGEPAIFDELIQEVYLKLCSDQCRTLADFTSPEEDAIYGFLKVVTANLVHDFLKSQQARKRGSGNADDPLPEDLPAAEGSFGGARQMEHQVFLREVEACLQSAGPAAVPARDRAVFWMYYRDGMTASAIAAVPAIGLTTKGVESLLWRMTHLLRSLMTRRESGGGKEFRAGTSF